VTGLTYDDDSHAFGGDLTPSTDDEYAAELLPRMTDETSSSLDLATMNSSRSTSCKKFKNIW